MSILRHPSVNGGPSGGSSVHRLARTPIRLSSKLLKDFPLLPSRWDSMFSSATIDEHPTVWHLVSSSNREDQLTMREVSCWGWSFLYSVFPEVLYPQKHFLSTNTIQKEINKFSLVQVGYWAHYDCSPFQLQVSTTTRLIYYNYTDNWFISCLINFKNIDFS